MEPTEAKSPGEIGTVPVCTSCGSERVVFDAWACFNPDSGLWELEQTIENAHCHQCDEETSLRWLVAETVPRQKIRELNDLLRTTGQGNGQVLITSGINEQGSAFVARVVDEVRQFNRFGEDNDPWGEHDFGSVEIDSQKAFWKIDYYNLDLTAGSENPANGGQTCRVLTIMLASEY